MAEQFGTTLDGKAASLYTLKNRKGMKAAISDYGATLVNLWVPDKDGQIRDVVLGYDDAAGYEKGDVFFGATVGRVANRIKGAQVEVNGEVYKLTANDKENTLHSGRDFYNKRIWQVLEVDDSHITMHILSPHLDQGFPGELDVKVTYTLTEEGELDIHYEAESDRDTVESMSNHSYFNLSGHNSGTILEQEVRVDADFYTPADAQSITTGEIVAVEGTPMDFREMKTLGRDIEMEYEALKLGCGYDHNWVLNGEGFRQVAQIRSEESGIQMEVYTDRPGMQMYTANFLDGELGKDGAVYEKNNAVCFETQNFPDAVHKENFPSPILKAGEMFDSRTIYKFS